MTTIEELEKQKAEINAKIEKIKAKDKERMIHHKAYHVGSKFKYCPECGVKLIERCPKFMELGKDCNQMGCPHFEQKMEDMRC